MKYDVVTIGDAFEDIFILPEGAKARADRSYASGMAITFELGEKIPIREINYEIGGSACNVAVGFARFGLSASVISLIGNDSSADKIKARLDLENVDSSNLVVDKSSKTNFSVILRYEEGRTIFVYRHLKNDDVLLMKKTVKPHWIFLAPTGADTKDLESNIITHVCEDGGKFAWNPGALQIKMGAGNYRSILKNTTVLIVNREEAIKFLNLPVRPMESDIIRKLQALGPEIVVMTNGKYGAMAYDGRHVYKTGVLPSVECVEATGAGDSFGVGFLGKLMVSGWNKDLPEEEREVILKEALRWGIFNSNSVILYVGAQKGLLTKTEIENQSARHKSLEVEVQ